MSAYGVIERAANSTVPLESTIWACKPHPRRKDTEPTQLTVHHLTLSTARSLPGLIDHLRTTFALDVEAGRTYPQETMASEGAFEAYFFAADVFVAVVGEADGHPAEEQGIRKTNASIEDSRKGRNWEDCIAGFYYVKPNYPGRSSHICNAGFIVSPKHRGGGYGCVIGKSYLHYGPALGYRASVFNLVYVNNVASVRIWESLNFTKAGLIPKAGRLKRADGQGEEYVDAWVFYKSFVDE